MKKQLAYTLLKWFFAFGAYAFLVYKLLTFDQYAELSEQWQLASHSRYLWLVAALLLLPVNIFVEAIKWRLLAEKTEKISLSNSFKAVFVGIATGFFTPNRVGELVGRVVYLSPENRKAGVVLSLVNSITQNLTFLLLGIPAAICFFYFTGSQHHPDIFNYFLLLSALLIVLLLVYLFLPRTIRFLSERKGLTSIKKFTNCLKQFSKKELLKILFVSIIRYVVFGIQYVLILRFFGVDLLWWQALIGIPTNYLFITFTPAFSFSEAAVRGSFAVLVFGAFSPLAVNIALAGICVWVINTMIPVMVGGILLVYKRK